MAQKRRGLGRGLQALIPETQREPSARRPTDVFFPSAAGQDEPAAGADGVEAQPAQAGSTGEPGGVSAPVEGAELSSHAAGIAETLLAPRSRGGRRRGGAAGSSRERSASKRVSRETSTMSDPGLMAELEEKSEEAKEVAVDVADASRAPAAAAEAKEVVEEEGAGQGAAQELVPVPGATFAELSVDVIVPNPRQPRQVFDEDDIAELAASIKEVGLLQPIVVRRVDHEDADTTYELVMGERRLRAAKEAGLDVIPAVVRYTEDQDLLRDALLENLHRVQLNPLEEAAAYQQLLEDFNCTHVELSRKIARSRSQISNTLRLMKLPPLVQRRLAAGVVSAGHARALLGLPDASAMERLAQRIVAEGLSVRATEELVALHDEPQQPRPAKRMRSMPMPALSTRLSDAFDTRVKVTRGAKKGRITIEFAGDEDLARIIETLAPGTSLAED